MKNLKQLKPSDIVALRTIINSVAEKINDKKKNKEERKILELNYRSARYEKEQNTFVSWKKTAYCNSIDDVNSMYGRKWRVKLNNLANLADFIKSFGKSNVVALPQTNKDLQNLFGTQQNVCKVIKDAINSGMIKDCQTGYSIGFDAKHYYVNEKKCAEVMWLAAATSVDSKEEKKDNENVNDDKYSHTFSTIIRFEVGKKNIAHLNDEQIVKQLHTTYGFLSRFDELNSENNSLLRQISHNDYNLPICKFTPSVTRKKGKSEWYVSKIGIRATNKACSLPKVGGSYTRYDYFDDFLGTSKPYEFDVKSSIYRVTYFLNKGKWLDNNVDFYQLMCPYEFVEENDRDNYKSFCMRLYFGKSAQDIWRCLKHDNLVDSENEEKNKQLIEILYDNMRNVIGDTYGSEIFLHESCIYMLLLNRLLKNNHKVVQIYDGFYSDDDIKEECLENIAECAAEYAQIAGFAAVKEDEEYDDKYSHTFSTIIRFDECKKLVDDVVNKKTFENTEDYLMKMYT